MGKNIVLAADKNYLFQVETLLKSICSHNKNITFYLLNNDISKNFFDYLNNHLAYFNSKIIDVKLAPPQELAVFENDTAHINYTTYFRILFSNVININKCLYLDSDIIIHGKLDNLFSIDLANYPLAAVNDVFMCIKIAQANNLTPRKSYYFNAGVLLLNLNFWRKNNLQQECLDILHKHKDNLVYHDQDILNILVKKYSWLALPQRYNYQPIAISHITNQEDYFYYFIPDETPTIIHYISQHKPWLETGVNYEYRYLFWFYANLSWEQIRKI